MELFDQAEAAALKVDTIVVPSATGGTQAGLIVAVARRSPGTRVAGVVVARPASELRPAIESMVRGLDPNAAGPPGAGRRSTSTRASSAKATAGPRPRPAEAADLLARTEGILVDPIYTAKALAALVAALRDGALDGQRVVFWHAGGLPGIFEPLD